MPGFEALARAVPEVRWKFLDAGVEQVGVLDGLIA